MSTLTYSDDSILCFRTIRIINTHDLCVYFQRSPAQPSPHHQYDKVTAWTTDDQSQGHTDWSEPITSGELR